LFIPTSLALLLPLAASISAIPTTRQAASSPPLSTSTNFYLIANVTDPASDFTPSIQGWTLVGYHVGAALNYGVLENPVTDPSDPDSGPGGIYFVNGTAEEVTANQGTVVLQYGEYPAGITVNAPDNAGGEYIVHINIEPGEQGIYIAPSPIPSLVGPTETGSYYACNNTIEGSSAIQLLFKYEGESTPEGCVDVNMLPQCVSGAEVWEFGDNVVDCYGDVAGIDWSLY